MEQGQTNRLLGYREDARLLIVNADDFGMCHWNNSAIMQALTGGDRVVDESDGALSVGAAGDGAAAGAS